MNSSLETFIEEYELLTSLSCGDLSVEEMQISLKYSEVFPHKITGSITGTVKKYNEFVPLINNQIPDKKITFNSSSAKNQYKVFSSDEIATSAITFPQGYPQNVSFEICKLELRHLSITQKIKKNEDRKICFYLVGPQRIWNFLGRFEIIDEIIKPKNTLKIEIEDDLPFNIELEVIKFEKSDEYKPSLTYSYEVFSLTFKAKKTTSFISDDELLKMCTNCVEEILLLVSFIGRKRIEWFCYKFYSSDNLITFIKENKKSDHSEPDFDSAFLGYHNTMKFIKQSLPNFRKLKIENFDLTKAIRYYLSGLEMPYLEAEFSTLFTSLECIKSLYAKKNKIDTIVSGNMFRKKISKTIKKELMRIKEDISDFPEDEMIKKIPELNRTSISTIIDRLTIDYDIEIKSLYPKNEEVTLIKTRNRITHDSNNVDIEILFKEYFRLRLLLEMLILKILKWDDLTKLIQSNDMHIFTCNEDENSKMEE